MTLTIFDEFLQLRRAFIRIFFLFAVSFLIFFAVSFGGINLFGVSVPALPGGTVAIWTIEKIRMGLLPAGASLVSLSPLDSFFAESSVAASLAFLLTLPFVAYEFWAFVAPGLLKNEKRELVRFFYTSVVLLLVGLVFAYKVLLPLIVQGLFVLTPTEVVPLYGLRSVVSMVTGMMLTTALIFLLPIVMMLLSKVGIVPASFWRRYTRHALFISLVFSAIITPDGSGLSMIILAVPIGVLYGLGYAGSVLQNKRTTLLKN